MKLLQLQNSWAVQSTADRAGRRTLTLSRQPLRQPARRRFVRRNGVVRLGVQSAPEELSGFAPAIRVLS